MTTTADMLQELKDFRDRAWPTEPDEVRALRQMRRQPMGNLPCVLYANFDTFWLGEIVQVLRQTALDGKLPLPQLCTMSAILLDRFASRTGKWGLQDTVRLIERLATYFRDQGPRSSDEFVATAEAALSAFCRSNAWIDAAIPWSHLDQKLTLHGACRQSTPDI